MEIVSSLKYIFCNCIAIYLPTGKVDFLKPRTTMIFWGLRSCDEAKKSWLTEGSKIPLSPVGRYTAIKWPKTVDFGRKWSKIAFFRKKI